MDIIGFAGKSGAGKTEAAGIVTAILARMGYSVKTDSFADPVRKDAMKRFGRLDPDCPEQRVWMQNRASEIRARKPFYFLNDFFRRNNMDALMWGESGERWEPADFLIIHDVRMANEVQFCRKHGVMVYIQGTHKPLSGEAAEHETELQVAELFHGADYIIVKQPSLSRLAAAIAAMVEAGCHLRKTPGFGEPTGTKGL